MPRIIKPKSATPPTHPTWDDAPEHCDTSRRRFLKQIGVGSGLLAAVGLPTLSHGQSLPINYDKLSSHPTSAEPRADVGADALGQSDLAAVLADSADSEADFDDSVADQAPASDEPELAEEVVENRALWIEPGYLLLIRWARPVDDQSPITALEGSADAISSFLTTQVSSVDSLHNLDQLHAIESALLTDVASRITPARIEVLHLDHDCTTVCNTLNPSREYPEIYEVMGDIAEPGWE